MGAAEKLITENLDVWTSAVKTKSSAGRGSATKREFYGVKRLRELILELAIRGLLVPQDPDDEPASELLKRIASEKTKLIEAGTIKKQKTLVPVSEEEKPFEVPDGWEWCKIGNAAISTDYGLSDKSFPVDHGVPVLAMGHIQFGKVLLGGQKRVPANVDSLPELYLEDRDLLYNRTNSAELVGKTGIYRGEDKAYTFASYLIRIRTLKDTPLPEMINLNMLAPSFRSTQIDPHLKQQCGQANVNGTVMKNMLVAVAPTHEMARIVAKVDELMALCHRLEQEQESSLETHETLVETLLNALTSASEQGQFEEAWQRIQANFDILFTTDSSIDQLKQTILQLAVMGKLAPQKQTAGTRSASMESGGGDLNEREMPMPFELPVNWKWCRLEKLTAITGGFAFKSSDYTSDGTRVIRISDFDEYGFKDEKIVRHDYPPELEKFSLKSGDILMAMTGGTVGKTFHVKTLPEQMLVNQRVATIRASSGVDDTYLNFVIQSKLTQQVIHEAKNSTNDNISMKDIKSFLIPLPPLAEQQEIVSKVEDLLKLCDQIQACLYEAQETQIGLADGLVADAVS
ncbi:MAG: restriction endonuclease subunit S [Verrucomicrobiales bacterium]|nr:restriction endonuclease subunit S [Verrucomicrobiales bacterium]